MHSQQTVARVLALRAEGLGARRIARQTELPVATVSGWLAGALPRHTRSLDPSSAPEPLCERCGHARHPFSELTDVYVYLLGLYLGDGCVSYAHRGVHRLRIALDTRYPGIIEEAAAAATSVCGHDAAVSAQRGNWVEVSSYWKAWPCLLPQAGEGQKHKRKIALTDWQEELIGQWPDQLVRGLIHSDGSRFKNTGRGGWVCPRYSFTQVSADIRAIFCHACELVGVRWTFSSPHTIYVSRKADVAKLDEFIGPKA